MEPNARKPGEAAKAVRESSFELRSVAESLIREAFTIGENVVLLRELLEISRNEIVFNAAGDDDDKTCAKRRLLLYATVSEFISKIPFVTSKQELVLRKRAVGLALSEIFSNQDCFMNLAGEL
jgi:hypothetical protein